jgi:hypothetical protein
VSSTGPLVFRAIRVYRHIISAALWKCQEMIGRQDQNAGPSTAPLAMELQEASLWMTLLTKSIT